MCSMIVNEDLGEVARVASMRVKAGVVESATPCLFPRPHMVNVICPDRIDWLSWIESSIYE